MPQRYTVTMENTTIAADATLVIVHAASSWGTAGCLLEVVRASISQNETETSQMLGAIIARKVTAFGTYTSATPVPHVIGAAASGIAGGTSGAAATSGVDASAEGAGATTTIYAEGFNNNNGWLWVPTPEERIWVGPDQAIVLKLRGTPTTLTGWNATLTYLEHASAQAMPGLFRQPPQPQQKRRFVSFEVAANVLVTPDQAALTLTTFAPKLDLRIVPFPAELAVTSGAPPILDLKINAAAPTALVLTTFAPTVTTSANQLVTPTTAALTLTKFAPVLDLRINAAAPTALTLTGFAPTVTTSNHQLVTPTTASLTLTAFAPTVTGGAGLTVVPITASLTTATFAPTVSTTDHQLVTPGFATLALGTFAPTVTASDHKTVTPTTASLVTTLFIPTVSVGAGSVSVTPGTASLVLTTYAPTINEPIVIGGAPPGFVGMALSLNGNGQHPEPAGAGSGSVPLGAGSNPKPR